MAEPNGRFSLDAKRDAQRAARNEADDARFTFTFGGRDFSLAAQRQWPAKAKRMLDRGDFADLLDVLLDEPEAFWSVAPEPTIQDVEDLFEAYGEWMGVGDLGESTASPPRALTPT